MSALLRLLDEPDQARAEPLIDQLANMHPDDRERVKQAAHGAPDQVRGHIEAAGIRARYLELEDDWERAVRGRLELEDALTVLSKSGGRGPNVEVGPTLDRYADEIGENLSGDRAFDTGLAAFNEVLFRKHGLRGNANDYYAPENSYLSTVLATGLGIPISLCSVALLVARRLELPVSGIGAPGHFLGFYGDVELKIGSYFNPYDGFERLTAGQLQTLLGQFVTTVEPGMLKPVGDAEILARFLRNLANAYGRLGKPEHIRNIERWNLAIGA